MDLELLDSYTDYLISSSGQVSSTGLSRVLGNVSHDKFTRFLRFNDFGSVDLWKLVKSTVREMEIPEGILVFDDTISHKPYTDENEIVTWHYNHTQGRSVKGICLLTGLYVGKDDLAIPVCYDIVKKDIVGDKGYRISSMSKNQRMRNCLQQSVNNNLEFKWVITDVWFSSAENMNYIRGINKSFIMPLKTNRKVALSLSDKQKGKYVPIESLRLEPGRCLEVYLEKIPSAVTLVKEEYANKDDSTAVLYLVCSDTTATYQQIITLYQKRWRVEEYHKSLKNNSSLSKSPTRTIKTQQNHLFLSIIGYSKLELFRMKKGMGQFALKSKLYTIAVRAAFEELRKQSAGIQLKFDFAA